jgi:hypothetical protein
MVVYYYTVEVASITRKYSRHWLPYVSFEGLSEILGQSHGAAGPVQIVASAVEPHTTLPRHRHSSFHCSPNRQGSQETRSAGPGSPAPTSRYSCQVEEQATKLTQEVALEITALIGVVPRREGRAFMAGQQIYTILVLQSIIATVNPCRQS